MNLKKIGDPYDDEINIFYLKDVSSIVCVNEKKQNCRDRYFENWC